MGTQDPQHLPLLGTPLHVTPTFEAADGEEQHSHCKQLHDADAGEGRCEQVTRIVERPAGAGAMLE